MDFLSMARSCDKETIVHRRFLHQYPEVGFDTDETNDYIKQILKEDGIDILPSTVGVLAKIPAPVSNGIIAIRADIDALEVLEETDLPYASLNVGKMHACGNDCHTAMLLSAAKIINENKDKLNYDVLLIFQPAEEGPDLGGARIFVQDFEDNGVLDDIKCIYGQHITSDFEVGRMFYRFGSMMASTDEFEVKIIGKGGNCSKQNLTIDALSAAAHIITDMESFVSKRTDPLDPVIFSVGTFNSGSNKNNIAEVAEFSGSIRCVNEDTRTFMADMFKNTLDGYKKIWGTDYELEIIKGLPVLNVEEQYVSPFIKSIAKHVPEMKTEYLREPQMLAEDFSYFSEKIPAIFTWLGAQDEVAPYYPVSSPHIIFDERALSYGVAANVCFAFTYGER